MSNTTKSELLELISSIRTEIKKDVKNGTQIPQFYKDTLEDLDRAEIAVGEGNYDLCFDIIGDINLDMLEIVDDLDDIIGITMKNLYFFKKALKLRGEDLPKEIFNLLEEIQQIIKKNT